MDSRRRSTIRGLPSRRTPMNYSRLNRQSAIGASGDGGKELPGRWNIRSSSIGQAAVDDTETKGVPFSARSRRHTRSPMTQVRPLTAATLMNNSRGEPGMLSAIGTVKPQGLSMNVQGRTYRANASSRLLHPKLSLANSMGSASASKLPEFPPTSPSSRRILSEQGLQMGSKLADWGASTGQGNKSNEMLPSVAGREGSNPNRSSLGGEARPGGMVEGRPIARHEDDEGVIFAVDPKNSGVHCVYRSASARALNPERLNLDRRNLTNCPALSGEEELRLLNFENNAITKITNLTNLPNLIFLDLYNNQIREIAGLDAIPSLRVLMLGKNSIRRVEGLTNLKKLDVLDLHSNRIARIANLGHLHSLRVLNLAGNEIEIMEGLEGLASLTELNLRRNEIHTLYDLDNLANLQRVFLSNNRIKAFDKLDAIFRLSGLSELTLDGNDLANHRFYREYVLDQMKGLKHLDMKRVTDDERRMSSIVVKNDERLEKQRRTQVTDRSHSIKIIEQQWLTRQKRVGNTDKKSGNGSLLPAAVRTRSYMELNRDKSVFVLYGSALETMFTEGKTLQDKDKIGKIFIRYYSFETFQDYVQKLKRFPRLSQLGLSHNNINNFRDLDSLATLALSELEIQENRIVSIPLYREYAIFALPTLHKLDGRDITPQEREESTRKFGLAAQLRQGTAPSIAPVKSQTTNGKKGTKSSKSSDMFPTSRVRKQSRHYTDRVLKDVVKMNKKVERLNEVWPGLVFDLIQETLTEIKQ